MSLLIEDATIIDGVAQQPIEGKAIWIERDRIKTIARRAEFQVPAATKVISARQKYVIPGLMNANAHLLGVHPLENISRYRDCFEDLIAEAAQVALKNGLTTIFDTYGPRRFLMNVRARINSGEIPGSRFFCAGNIIGFDGPFSADFFPKSVEVVSTVLAKRINAIWVENVGRHLMWLTPEQVAHEVRTYIGKGIDFIKYAANDHFPGAFIAFSERAQAAMIEEAHRAGVTAQAHTMSVEGLRMAVEAGCDLIQHMNITGPTPIPETTLDLIVKRKTGAVIFAWTQKGMDWIMKNVSDMERMWWRGGATNARNLIRSGASLLLGNDAMMISPEMLTDPQFGKGSMGAPDELQIYSFTHGHFLWFKAMEEMGCPPMEMLRAATRNIAVAYGQDKQLGTLEPGKIADLLILDKNPLQGAENYRSIHTIIHNGAVVDRDALPVKPILTAPLPPPADEEASFTPFITGGQFPICPMCVRH
jgi:imidazolonepropionase-like amidohydrolase